MDRFLKSKYKIDDKIGEGPFSYTYKGFLMGTQVPVIIKIYKRAALNSPLINRLKPKVLKMVNLDHPFVAKILDGDYGWQGYYFVREFIDGESLNEILRDARFNIHTTIEIVKRIGEALRFAHDNGVIHGSLGTNNVYISNNKELKVVDFILEGKVRGNVDLLAQQTYLDTRYLSPEQIKGEAVSHLSDIYSLGVIFYQLLTGKLPFKGGDNLATAIQHINVRPEPPSSINPEVPSYLDEIVLKAMEKDPIMRFKNISEIEESLKEKALIFKGASVDLSNLIYDDSEALDSGEEEIEEEPQKPVKRVKKGSSMILWVLFFVLVAIAVGLWYSFIQGFVNLR